MDVAAGDRVADAEEPVSAVGVAAGLLRAQVEQGGLVDLAEVAGTGTQRGVQVIGRQGAVLDDDVRSGVTNSSRTPESARASAASRPGCPPLSS
jgi:hypothetical protein